MPYYYSYSVYIITNKNKTTLYIGVTNDLYARLQQHFQQDGKKKSFAGRYGCHKLLYWENYDDINQAIAREKEIKKWCRAKKEALINSKNPTWSFLNDHV